ncbi:MAG: pilus assembly protein [Oscillochloris sp.]|nr:pilus assembly protein [Oscillochloris sp.]
MFHRKRTKRSTGQALVEFALAATLIFTLLSAAVDLGLIFFTMQQLRAAAQEGATFGSYPQIYPENATSGEAVQRVDLNYSEIINRVRHSSGDKSGFANLLDLDNDGTDDGSQGSVLNYTSSSAYIYIQNLRYNNDDLTQAPTGSCATTTARYQMRKAGEFCYVRVTVSYEYRFLFPLAPVFKDTIKLSASYMVHVRSSFIG